MKIKKFKKSGVGYILILFIINQVISCEQRINMPRPSINLEPYKAEIIQFFMDDRSCLSIKEFLADRYGVEVNERTIYSRIRNWGIHKKKSYSKL